MGVLDHSGKVVDASELGCDGQEVADVVAAVTKRRWIKGQEPDAVDTQPLEVLELFTQTREIPDPVRVGIEEAPREELVEDGSLIPSHVVQAWT
jgi:hypothetical protein